MSVKNVVWVFEHSPYKGEKLLVHLALADIANEDYDDRLWLDQKKIAEKARITREGAGRILKILEADGYIIDTGERFGQTSKIKVIQLIKKVIVTEDHNSNSDPEPPQTVIVETGNSDRSENTLSINSKELKETQDVEKPEKVLAQKLAKELWDERKASNKPQSATPYIGVVKVIEALLKAGYPENQVAWGIRNVPTISTGWVEGAINKRKTSNAGTVNEVVGDYLASAK